MAKTKSSPSSLFLRALFNSAVENNILLMNSEGIILTANKAFCANFGYSSSELRGKNIAVLFTEEDRQKGLPQRELNSVLKSGQGSDNNYLVAADKTTIWVSGESVLAQKDDGKLVIVKMIQNIHRQKVSELALKNLYELNEDILKSIKDPVVVLTGDLKIIKVNDAFIKHFPLAEQAGLPDFIMPYDTGKILLHNIEYAFLSGKPFQHIPFSISTANRAVKTYEASGSLMQFSDGVKNLLLVLHDVTFRKQLETEREDIMGFVAHEVRNPLANLGLCHDLLDMLLKNNRQTEIPDILQRNKNNITRLNKIIAELYSATKTSAGNLQLELADYNFGDVIVEAVETIQSLHPDFIIEITQNVDCTVTCDKYRIIEVVNNYLSNGIKYSNGNNHISLKAVRDSKFITVSVKDLGSGIPKEQLPYIFERYFRVSKTQYLEGLGLGLYLCRKIIEAHNGKVWAESGESSGSIFHFAIPVTK